MIFYLFAIYYVVTFIYSDSLVYRYGDDDYFFSKLLEYTIFGIFGFIIIPYFVFYHLKNKSDM